MIFYNNERYVAIIRERKRKKNLGYISSPGNFTSFAHECVFFFLEKKKMKNILMYDYLRLKRVEIK